MPVVQKILTHALASDFSAMNLDLATGWRIVHTTFVPAIKGFDKDDRGIEREMVRSSQATAFVLEKDMDDGEYDAYVAAVKEERSRR